MGSKVERAPDIHWEASLLVGAIGQIARIESGEYRKKPRGQKNMAVDKAKGVDGSVGTREEFSIQRLSCVEPADP